MSIYLFTKQSIYQHIIFQKYTALTKLRIIESISPDIDNLLSFNKNPLS